MKKLISVLLALTMCAGLAIPAFAESVEEVPVPEEVEVLTIEEDHGHKHEDEAIFYLANAVWIEEIEEDVIVDVYQQLMPTDNTVLPDSMLSITPPVKDHAHWIVLYEQKEEYVTDANQHQLVVYRKWKCSDSTCGYRSNDELPGNPEPHSWIKGSLKGYQSNASTHTATYDYSCSVCGKTTTKPETESHSMTRNYTGNNFHKGTLHYFEYEERCTRCDYIGTKTVSYSCPGPSGGGCITINKKDPPVEELDVTEPEEATEPEVADIPDEVEMPEETEAPEETVDTEDPAGSEEPGQTE